MPKKKKNTPENADEPYDSVRIEKDASGKYCAVFYVAAERHENHPEFLDGLEFLVIQQRLFHNAGFICPLTDKAIRLLREAMNLPDLH